MLELLCCFDFLAKHVKGCRGRSLLLCGVLEAPMALILPTQAGGISEVGLEVCSLNGKLAAGSWVRRGSPATCEEASG